MRVNIESRAGAQQLLTEGAHLLKRLEPYLTHNVDLLAKLVVQ
jgi:hypothetical protein